MSGKKAKKTAEERSQEISEAEMKSLTSWKLDLLETVNADPMTTPTDLAIVEAYLHFVRAKSRTAYLSALSLRVRTGIASAETVTARRKVLVKLGYFVPNGRTKTGIEVYQIVNARQNIVLDHVTIASEKLREMDAERKKAFREKRRIAGDVPPKSVGTRSANVPPKSEITNGACPTKNPQDVPPIIEDKHLEGTPIGSLGTERRDRTQDALQNEYLKASRGW